MSKRTIMTILLIAASGLLLSGCTGNTTEKQQVSPSVTSNKDIIPITTSTEKNIESSQSTQSNQKIQESSKTLNTSKNDSGPSWCSTGSKKKSNDGREFTITNLTADHATGKELCRAEIKKDNGTTVFYFSEDGSVQQMSDVSTSGNSTASSTSSSIISK